MNRKVSSSEPNRSSVAGIPQEDPLPKISKGLLRIFLNYSEGYLRRQFHTVRLLRKGVLQSCDGLPIVIYFNHSSWWDPLVCLVLARWFFPGRSSYGPIEVNALGRYRFLRRLGLFGIERGTPRGAAEFLRTASAMTRNSDCALWIAPQGKFVDDRTRPLDFERGLSHLATRVQRAAFIPLAIEYTFWEERLPELLFSFGDPVIFGADRPLNVADATRLFQSALASVQDQLSAASQRRRSDEWRVMLSGRAGTTSVYDLWRRARARLRGEPFSAAHSDL